MPLIAYPYSLTAHTTAKASEVMGNFNAIAAVLNGGVDKTNLAPGYVPTLSSGTGGEHVMDQLAGTATTVIAPITINLKSPSAVKVDFSSDCQLYVPNGSNYGITLVLVIDGVNATSETLRHAPNIENQGGSGLIRVPVNGHVTTGLAAGAHQFSVLGYGDNAGGGIIANGPARVFSSHFDVLTIPAP